MERNQNDITLIIYIIGQEISISLKKYIKPDKLNKYNLSEGIKTTMRNEKIILGIDLETTYSCAM